MENYQEKCNLILTALLENRHQLEILFQRNIDKNYWDFNDEVRNLLGFDLSIDFLYYGSGANDKDAVFDEVAIDKTQCLIDFGVFLLTNPFLSPFLKWKIIDVTNVRGYIFDRHSYSYFVHQNKLFLFVNKVSEIFESVSNTIESKNYQNPKRFNEFLDENCSNIENRIREILADSKFGYTFNEMQLQKNLKQISQVAIDEVLSSLMSQRNLIKQDWGRNRFSLENQNQKPKTNETKPRSLDTEYIVDLELKRGSNIEVIIEMSENAYANIFQSNTKNIGGRVALADTSLEFEKLMENDTIKFRNPKSVNFTEVENKDNLFILARNEAIEIVSIETKR